MKKDNLYNRPFKRVEDFSFNKEVAAVFNDMIKRSVPGYEQVIAMTQCVAQKFGQRNTSCYDLGCSLGAATAALAMGISEKNVHIIGVDNAPDMVDLCRKNLNKSGISSKTEIICADIRDIEIKKASIVICNFTLQFVPRAYRAKLVQKIYRGLRPGGALMLSEKILFKNKPVQKQMTELHHVFKRMNGYSDLEIAQKRTALEKILLPETVQTHKRRLKNAGFRHVFQWFQCFNFSSFLAIK